MDFKDLYLMIPTALITGVVMFILNWLKNRSKDSLDYKVTANGLLKKQLDQITEVADKLSKTNEESKRLHKKEIEQERAETARYRKMVDDLIEAHKEKDSQIEDMRQMLDQNKKTIASWSESDVKKDLIIKDLKSKLS